MQTFDVLQIGDKTYVPQDWKTILDYHAQQVAHEMRGITQTKDPDALVSFDELADMVDISNRSVGLRCKRLKIDTVPYNHSKAIKQKFVPKFISNK